MAVVGEAHILVKAITTNVARDITNSLKGLSGSTGSASRRAGESIGEAFSRGFNGRANGIFAQVAEGLRNMAPEADAARLQFRSLVRTGYTLGTALVAVLGGISALIGGFISLAGAAGGAAVSLLGVVGGLIQLRLASGLARFAMNGISQAVSAATSQTGSYAESVKQAQENLQQLQFQAEEASLSQERAALNLERAKERLLRSQDLPTNSRERRDAELAFKEADLAYRRAKDRNADLKKELDEGAESGAAGANDPYANLTPAQKEFAKFLVSLKPLIQDLRDSVARGFLPVLQTQIGKVIEAFDGKLGPALERFGDSLGLAVTNFTTAFIENSDAEKIITLLDNAGPNIAKFGAIAGKFFSTFLQLLIDAEPLTDGFFGFLSDSVDSFTKFLNKARSDGSLKKFFEDSMKAMSDFGVIFGNIFGGIGAIIQANIGPGTGGQALLDYFKQATAGFGALDGAAEGEGSLRQFFLDAANGAIPVLDLIGGIIKAFLDLGTNEGIKEAFTTLAKPENIQTFSDTLQKMGDAAPSLANLAVSIGDIIAAITDSEAPSAFFDTLNIVFSQIAAVLQNETVAGVVNFISKIFAVISALTLLGGIFKFAFNVLIGNLVQALFGVNLLATAFTKIQLFAGKAIAAVKGGFAALGVILKAKALAFILNVKLLFFRFAIFAIQGLLSIFLKVAPLLIKAVVFAKAGLKILFIAIRVFALGLFQALGGALLTLGRVIFTALTGPWGIAIAAIVAGLTFFFTQTDVGKKIWADFMDFLKNLWDGLVDKFKMVADFLGDLFNDPIGTLKNLWVSLMNFFIAKAEGFINMFVDGMNGLINGAVGWLADLAGAAGLDVPMNIIPKVKLGRIPALADGAVAYPSPGGTLVQVAEAGRPERIEPLDPNGLSDRDKALIAEMSGGGATINVYPSPGMDERELAEMVSRRIATEIRRGSV